MGELLVQVHYGELMACRRLVAVSRNDPTLLVRDRLQSLKLDWHQICLISYQQPAGLQPLLGCFKGIFKEELGTVSIHKQDCMFAPIQPQNFSSLPLCYSAPRKQICQLLLSYRTTTHATTNRVPSVVLLQRELQTRFDLVKPPYVDQAHQSRHHDQHAQSHEI